MSEGQNVTYERNGKIKAYIDDMTSILTRLYPEKDKTDIQKLVKEKTMQAYAEAKPTVAINDNVVPINTMDKYIMEEDLIIAGSGSLYLQHDKADNVLTKMIAFLKDERTRYKDLMFKYMDEGDSVKTSRYNTRQITVKLFNNSLYGVLTQANSIFYNPLSGPSITESGQDITTTAVIAFERFMAGNIFMDTVNDAFVYMNNIISEDPYGKSLIQFKTIPNVDMVLEWILSKIDNYTDFDEDILYSYLSNLTDNELLRIYYKNNLLTFLNDTNLYEDYMVDIVARDDFLDPNNPPKEIIDNLKNLWGVLEDYVFYNYQDYHRFRNMTDTEDRPRKRKAILVIDTDSNFIQLHSLVDLLSRKQGKTPDTIDFDHRITIVNTIMYLNNEVIKNVYHRYTNEIGIHDDKTNLIKMKNEYYYSRIMMTRNKKNYAGIVALKEGHLVKKSKQLDIKGLAIRKVNTNTNARELFTDILGEDILKAKEIDIPQIIRKYKEFEIEIHDSLLNGSAEYGTPAKANSASSYKIPFSIAPFRGAMLWTKLYPENEIVFPARVISIKLAINSIEDVYEQMTDEHFIKVFEDVFSDEDMLIGGQVNTISLPEGTKEIPEQLIPFIDADTIVNNTIKPGLILLESLGVRLISNNRGTYPSTIITL